MTEGKLEAMVEQTAKSVDKMLEGLESHTNQIHELALSVKENANVKAEMSELRGALDEQRKMTIGLQIRDAKRETECKANSESISNLEKYSLKVVGAIMIVMISAIGSLYMMVK